MTQTSDQILAGIAAILTQPAAWTQGAMARTGNKPSDFEVHTSNPQANCFCLLGARRKIIGPIQNEPGNRTLIILAEAVKRLFPDRIRSVGVTAPVSFQVIAWFNDDPLTTHHDVLQVVATARVIQNEV